MWLLQISAVNMPYLCIRRPNHLDIFSLQLMTLFLLWRGRSPYTGDLDRSTRAQPVMLGVMSGLLSSMKAAYVEHTLRPVRVLAQLAMAAL